MLKLVSNVALLVVVGTLLALALSKNLFSVSPVVIGAQVAAVLLAVWARRSFPSGSFRVMEAPSGGGLIKRGPYRVIRHPMYTAALLVLWSGVLSHAAPWSLAAGVIVTSVVAARIVHEERLLRGRYADFAEYAKSTKAVVPFVV